MSVPWPFDPRWADEWERSWAELLSLPSAAAAPMGMPVAGMLPGDLSALIAEAVRTWLIGKRRTFRISGRELTMTLDDFSVTGTDLARSMGQYGEIHVTARDIEWAGGRIERMYVQARNVHLRPAAPPKLVTAPVLWQAVVSASCVTGWLGAAASRFELTLDAGVPCIGLAGRSWARAEVVPVADGRSIWLQPCALRLGGRRLPLRLPAYRVSLAALPRDVTVTAVEAGSAGVVLRGFLREWQRSPSRSDVERLLAALRAGSGRIYL